MCKIQLRNYEKDIYKSILTLVEPTFELFRYFCIELLFNEVEHFANIHFFHWFFVHNFTIRRAKDLKASQCKTALKIDRQKPSQHALLNTMYSGELRGGDWHTATWLAGRGYAGMWLVQEIVAWEIWRFVIFALKIMAAKRRRIDVWTRDDIVCCKCSEVKSRHVHCPCLKCNGAAVARSVEYSHWQQHVQQKEIADLLVNRWE